LRCNVNRHDDAAVNGDDTGYRCRYFDKEQSFMKQLVAALAITAFSAVALGQGTTPPASGPATASSASTSAPAKSGTTKKAKKKKAKKSTTGAANASAPSPTK